MLVNIIRFQICSISEHIFDIIILRLYKDYHFSNRIIVFLSVKYSISFFVYSFFFIHFLSSRLVFLYCGQLVISFYFICISLLHFRDNVNFVKSPSFSKKRSQNNGDLEIDLSFVKDATLEKSSRYVHFNNKLKKHLCFF